MSKIVYLYDPLTGEFKDEYLAQQSPLEPSVYIEPEHSTPKPPLPIEEHKFNHFDGEQWTLKDDTRGVWFTQDRLEVIVSELDETIDPTWTRVKRPLTQSELKQYQLSEINTAFENSMRQITDSIPATERESWAKQETEARAYINNNSAQTPLIDALASSRSVDKAELVGRIIAKADLFAGISGTLIGRRQALEDDLDALPETATAEDVAAISWL